jgi:hypothetical protein
MIRSYEAEFLTNEMSKDEIRIKYQLHKKI